MQVEPDHSESRTQSPVLPSIHCRNCSRPIVGTYCYHCGQHSADHNHGLWQFVVEFSDEFVRLDSKFIRTLNPLCFKPGFLTKEWVAGKRIRYITPLKLYLTLSAIFFLLLSTHPEWIMNDAASKRPGIIQIDDSDKVKKATSKSKKDSSDDWLTTMMTNSVGQMAGPGEDASIKRKALAEKFRDQLPTANFILIPFFAFLFKVLYARRSRFYVEHLVFALHYYSFCFLCATIGILLSSVRGLLGSDLSNEVAIWAMLYLPIAMAKNYEQGVIKTLFKSLIFGLAYLMMVAVTALALLLVAATQVSNSAMSVSKPATNPVVTGQVNPTGKH